MASFVRFPARVADNAFLISPKTPSEGDKGMCAPFGPFLRNSFCSIKSTGFHQKDISYTEVGGTCGDPREGRGARSVNKDTIFR